MNAALPLSPLLKLLSIGGLAGLCVAVHATGLMVMSRWFRHGLQRTHHHFWTEVWLLIRISWGLIFLHILEIMIWGGFYLWKGILADLNTAFYFSSITYTTVGYGDVVLSPTWRNFSSAEALVGILMAGLSTSFFFMFLSRLFSRRFNPDNTPHP